MTHQILLQLLTANRPRNGTRQTPGEDGFSFLAILFVVLAVTLGTVAIANRNSLGSLGSAYQSQGRIARAAAEIGMASLVSELNRPRNRPLLVNAESLNLRTVSAIETAPAGTFNTQDMAGGSALNPSLSATFSSGLLSSQVINVGDGSRQRWQFVSASTSNPTLNSARSGVTSSSFGTVNSSFSVSVGSNTVPARAGDITFQVNGYAYQNGTKVATATLTQTFEVVPKCQARSLRGHNSVFGNDTRACPLGLGLLFLAGAANNNTGSFDITGSTKSTTINVTPSCITPTGTCSPFDLGYNPIVYTPPAISSAQPPLSATLQAQINKCRRSDSSYLGNATCNYTNNTKYTNASPLATSNFSSWPTALQSLCAQEIISSKLITVCSFNKLINANDLVFDTAGGPIRLYFPNPDASAAQNDAALNNGSGNNSIRQINTATSTPLAGDFAFFGCDSIQCPSMPYTEGSGANAQEYAQKFYIDTGNGSFGPGFTYFPFGLLFAGGSGGFSGVAWQNGFNTLGNTSLSGTQGDLDSVAALMGIDAQTTGSSNTPPLIDYVTRAVRSISFF